MEFAVKNSSYRLYVPLAVIGVLIGLTIRPFWSRVTGHPDYQILSSSGKKLFSVFEGLPRSPRADYRHLTARERSCPPVPKGVGSQTHKTTDEIAMIKTAFEPGVDKGRYVPVQASDCGGAYATCVENFCTIDCTYVECWAGGPNYCDGWQTGYWNGCCYGDAGCNSTKGCGGG
jgi:hypothetical protein